MSWQSFEFTGRDRERQVREFKLCLERAFASVPVQFFAENALVVGERIYSRNHGYAMSRSQFAALKPKLRWFEIGWREGRGVA